MPHHIIPFGIVSDVKPYELIAALVARDGGTLPVAKAMRAPSFQGTLHKICSGRVLAPTRGSAERIAAHFGIPIDAIYNEKVATETAQQLGLEARSGVTYPSAESKLPEPPRVAEGVAQSLSLHNPTVIQTIKWDELMDQRERLPDKFESTAPDDSMAPALPAGTIVYFDTTLQPASGDGVLVCDDAGNLYIRQYKLRRADHWEAHAFNQAVLPLDSQKDGLKVLAVVTGQRARWSGIK